MKILFLDADGTLFHPSGYIPESAILACQQAQANGHKVCLCTGRQKDEIFGDLKKIDYDGIIAGSGASIQVKGITLKELSFSSIQFKKIHDYLESRHIPSIYESSQGLFGYSYTKQALQELVNIQCKNLDQPTLEKHGLYRLYHQVHVVDDMFSIPVSKISFLKSKTDFDTIKEDLQDSFDIIPATFAPFGKGSGEISSKDITKATGMNELIQYYNIDKKNVIAIGDGFNDLVMFENAAISIAMGNAPKEVQKKADRITTSLENDGIYNAFKNLNLLG